MFRLAALASVAILGCASAFAGSVDDSGVLNITGSVQISNGEIQFAPFNGVSGDFLIGVPGTGVFAPLLGTTGNVLDLNSATEPVNQMVNVPDFMTFNAAPNLSFTLTELPQGTDPLCDPNNLPPPAAGQACTLPGTPYDLTNQTANSSTASFAVIGYVVDTNNPGVQTPFTGVFTTQFQENFQSLVATVLSGGEVSATFSATFTATSVATPEPASTVTMLSGGLLLIGIGVLGKRFRRARA